MSKCLGAVVELIVVAILLLSASALGLQAATIPLVLGIDFGSTATRISVERDGSVETVPNDKGADATPSYVGWDPSEKLLIGEDAMRQAWVHPETTLFDFKWLLGKSYDEAMIEAKSRGLPYKIVNRSEKPMIQVAVAGDTKEFTPEQVTAILFSKVKQDAEAYLASQVVGISLSVPVCFSDAQRNALIDAATHAGMTVLSSINEPTSALIGLCTGYCVDRKINREKTAIVVDTGGGRVEITVLLLEGGVFEVLARRTVYGLNGRRVSETVLAHVMDKWRIDDDGRMQQRLWTEIERIKHQLSKEAKAAIPLDSETGDDLSLNEIVTPDLFNELNAREFANLEPAMNHVLTEAGVQAGEIDEIVFVGGSSHLLRLRQLVSEFFDGKSWAHTRYLSDSAVADGAAVHGGAMSRDREDSYWFDCLHTGVSLSLGVETAGGLMHELISRQTSLPHIRSMRLTTFHDNQTEVTIRIFAGERPLAKYNRLVGALTLRGLAPTPSGLHNVVLTLSVDDTNSFVVVSAAETTTGNQDEATLPIAKHRFIDNADVVVQLIKKADAHIEGDTREAERVEFCLQNRKLSEVDCAGIVVTSDAVVPISLLLTANDEEF